MSKSRTAPPPEIRVQTNIRSSSWQSALGSAIRDPDLLISLLGLPDNLRVPAREAALAFPLLVTHSFLARMRREDPADPLLLQVLPLGDEALPVAGFTSDPLDEASAHQAPGLLQKYAGRALLVTTGLCAIHCRYCFRRSYPYADEPKRLADWEAAIERLRDDASIHEIILSGGDPLVFTDARLQALLARLDAVTHLARLRIHTRLPIVLPDRVTRNFIRLLRSLRMTPIVVVHANHPNEVAGDCAAALRRLVRGGLTVLNQAVLLRGINDSVEAQAELSERLVNLGVMPYYLHQLDRTAGTSHFEVREDDGRRIVEQLRCRLPGYAVPRYVREVPGETHKLPLI